MAGVSIDTNPTPSLPPDFSAALEGGEGFLKRLGVLQQAKKDADAAVEQLNLGRSVAQAHAEADAAITQKRTEADKYATDAKARADRLVAQASAKAKALVDEANGKAEQIKAMAQALHDNAATEHARAAELKQQAQQVQQKVTADAAAAVSLRQQLENSMGEARTALQAANAREAEFKTRLKKLTDAARQATE